MAQQSAIKNAISAWATSEIGLRMRGDSNYSPIVAKRFGRAAGDNKTYLKLLEEESEIELENFLFAFATTKPSEAADEPLWLADRVLLLDQVRPYF